MALPGIYRSHTLTNTIQKSENEQFVGISNHSYLLESLGDSSAMPFVYDPLSKEIIEDP